MGSVGGQRNILLINQNDLDTISYLVDLSRSSRSAVSDDLVSTTVYYINYIYIHMMSQLSNW